MDSDMAGKLNSEMLKLAAFDEALRTQQALQHAEPGSDLSVDEARLPDVWATTVVHRSLLHTVECLRAAGEQIMSEAWMHTPFVLMRGAYESAALAVWLLEPESADVRLGRLIAQHKASWKYSQTAYSGTPLDDKGLHDARLAYAAKMIEIAGVDPSECKLPGFEKLIKDVDDFPGEERSYLTAWRVCSGVSHAKTWALDTVTTEVDRKHISGHVGLSARMPDLELAFRFLCVGRRTVERACIWRDIRRTARPHSIRMGMSDTVY